MKVNTSYLSINRLLGNFRSFPKGQLFEVSSQKIEKDIGKHLQTNFSHFAEFKVCNPLARMASRSQEHADCNFHNFKLSSIFISSVFTPMILPVFRFLSLNNPYLQCSKKTVTSSPGGTSFSDIKQGGGSRELSTQSDLHTSIFLLICKSLRFTIIPRIHWRVEKLEAFGRS